jgi:hypothetical protein
MKNKIKYLGLLTIIIAFFNCSEESNFKEPDIALVPVYAITNIVGTNAPYAINIYQQKSLIVEYSTSVNPVNYVSSNYVDSSTETNYEISVSKLVEGGSISYLISADKETGIGTLSVDGGTVYTITISETEVYN